jgi:hypothetical protein
MFEGSHCLKRYSASTHSNNTAQTANHLAHFPRTSRPPVGAGAVERFEGNSGLVFLFGVTGFLLLALVTFVLVQAASQFATFTLPAAACGIFGLGSLGAAGLFLLYSAREAGSTFVVDDEGITRRAWGRVTTIAWHELVRLEEFNAIGSKAKPGGSGRSVIYGLGGARLVIPFPFVADGPRLRGRLEPHFAPLRAAELHELLRHGRTIRPGRTVGVVVLTFMSPMFLMGGLSAFDRADNRMRSKRPNVLRKAPVVTQPVATQVRSQKRAERDAEIIRDGTLPSKDVASKLS